MTYAKGVVLLLLIGVVSADVMTADGLVDSEEAGQVEGQAITNCSCGYTYNAAGRIVGGVETRVNEYPYMVRLLRVVPSGQYAHCGGSIITRRHVLTAAHCTVCLTEANLLVVVGEHNTTTTSETNYTRFIEVTQISQHFEYNSQTKVNDISLLTTLTTIPFSDRVGPICLPTTRLNLTGQYLRVTGWGRLSSGGPGSNVLMKVDLQVIPLANCSAKYPIVSSTSPTQICTYSENKDSCQGDSGGPLAWLDPATNRFVQAALVSFGTGCALPGYPGVNVDVSAYITWIQRQITVTTPLTGYIRQRTCSRIL